jgi:hypothetical protein
MLKRIADSSDKINKTVYRTVFVFYTAFLFTVTLMPLGILESEEEDWLTFLHFKQQDKVVHFLLFWVYTGLLYFAFKSKKVYLFFIPVLTGIFIEILQYSLDLGRNFDAFDILANSLGTLCMILLLTYLKKTPSNFKK